MCKMSIFEEVSYQFVYFIFPKGAKCAVCAVVCHKLPHSQHVHICLASQLHNNQPPSRGNTSVITPNFRLLNSV